MSGLKWKGSAALALSVFLLTIFFVKPCHAPSTHLNGETADSLRAHDYTVAEQKPARLPSFIKPEDLPGAKPILSAHGQWTAPRVYERGDSLPVEVSVVDDGDTNTWVGVWIDGEPVAWTEAPRVDIEPSRGSPWAVIGEFSFLDGEITLAPGLSWTPLPLWGTEMGLGATISPVWATPSFRVVRRLGPIDVGFEAGYRIGYDSGFRPGVSLGLRVDMGQ